MTVRYGFRLLAPLTLAASVLACPVPAALRAPVAGIQASSSPSPSDPVNGFEELWSALDRQYALFDAKRIDWKRLHAIYRPQVSAASTDDQLFATLSAMLEHLNDNHVSLRAGSRSFQSGILGQLEMGDFSLALVRDKYLRRRYSQAANGRVTSGWLTPAIAYVHVSDFEDPAIQTGFDRFLEEAKDAAGIVIDVRANSGGDDRLGKALADRLADRRTLYMTTQTRIGPAHSDFSAKTPWFVEPGGAFQFSRPVAVLTHRFSVSAAENFVLALRHLPHVTTIGDATSGVFADVTSVSLPNGWRVRFPNTLFLDDRGFCWEGIGVPAQLRVTNAKADIAGGADRVLEFALRFLATPRESLDHRGPGSGSH